MTDTGGAMDTKSQTGVLVGCTRCGNVVRLPTIEGDPRRVALYPLDGWGMDPVRCPDCVSVMAGVSDLRRAVDARLDAVRDLHAERRRDVDGYTLRWCRECQSNWPCPTMRALGEDGTG